MGTRASAPVLALPNQRWSPDFVHDHMASGRRFRVLNVVDDPAYGMIVIGRLAQDRSRDLIGVALPPEIWTICGWSFTS